MAVLRVVSYSSESHESALPPHNVCIMACYTRL
jgi:hypothetical protein